MPNKPVTNDDLYERYIKLIYLVIHRWSTKPINYLDHFDDVVSEVLIELFKLPLYGSRRKNPSYINTVIQTCLSSQFKRIKKIQFNEALEIKETSAITSNTHTMDWKIDFNTAFDTLNIDEQIVLTAFFDLGYKRKCYAIKEIAKMLYQTKENTQIILDNALNSIRKNCYNKNIKKEVIGA